MEDISIGNELKDGFKQVDAWVKAGLSWLTDLEQFYKERASIEREYSEKLKSLCANGFTKRAKMVSLLSVGENPTITPGSLESASMVAWNEILTQTEQISRERANFASEIDKRVVGSINDMSLKYDALKTKWGNFNTELTTIRDKHYEDVNKSKKDYDSSCQAMESQRTKSEKSSSEKSQHKYQKREHEMNIAKNDYLIKINIANRLKDKYYYQDLPEILDGLQGLNEAKVSKLNSIWLTASVLEKNVSNSIIKKVEAMDEVTKQNLPKLDTAMFVKHNLNDWKEPQDFYYIPSSIWHDDDAMIVEGVELNSLKERLNASGTSYEKFDRICLDEKQQLGEILQRREEVMGDTFSKVQIKSREEYFKFEDLMNKSLIQLQKFTNDDTRKVVSEVEVETIQTATEGKDMTITRAIENKKKSRFGGLFKGGSKGTHSQNEDIDNNASDIQSLASGMSKVTVHTTQSGSTKTRLFESVSKAFSGKTPSSASTSNDGPTAKALYPYAAGGDDEISISTGDILNVLELDDGSGWTSVQIHGQSGLVPTSYIQIIQQEAPLKAEAVKKQGPKVAPRRGAKKIKYMEILYNYEPTGDDELGVGVGDKVQVITEDDGSGWTEGEIEGIRGLFPSSYGRMV